MQRTETLAQLPVSPGSYGIMHIAFGMDNIDKVMPGAYIIEKRRSKNRSVNAPGAPPGIAFHLPSISYVIMATIQMVFRSLLWPSNAPPIFRLGHDFRRR